MQKVYESHSINNAKSIEEVVEIVNSTVSEGIELIEFTSEMLAGCYIKDAVLDDDDTSSEALEAQAEILADHGANFDALEAIEYANKLLSADY